jgi:hypothetical protein
MSRPTDHEEGGVVDSSPGPGLLRLGVEQVARGHRVAAG